jgi:Putative zinc-finger
MGGDLVHLTEQQLLGYRSRILQPAELVRTDLHLSSCWICQRKLRDSTPTPSLPIGLPDPAAPLHLTFEQMSAYIDSQIPESERERVETHVLICERCADELKGLQAFEITFAKQPQAAPVQAEPSIQLRLTEWLSRFFAAPQRIRYVGVSLCVIVFGFLTMSRMQVEPSLTSGGDASFQIVSHLGSSSHPVMFLGGFLLIAVGVVGFFYGLFRKF